jgi:MFS family permease
VLAVLLAPPVLAVLDAFAVVIALPSIQRQLHTSIAGAQLVVAGYVVAYASVLITAGRLGDLHGHRRLLVVGLGLFLTTSLVAAAAPNQEVLIVARILQGAGAALMYPQTLALVRIHFRGQDLVLAMGAFGVALGLASVSAQLVAGLLLQADLLGLGWRAIFAINLPIGAAAAGLALLWIPESASGGRGRGDHVGGALLTAGLLAFVFPLVVGRDLGWPLWTWPVLAIAGGAGVAFVRHERRLTDRAGAPLLSLHLFRIKTVVFGLLTTLTLYAGQLSFWVLLTWHLQNGLGLPPLTTGLVFAVTTTGFMLGAVSSPPLLDRINTHVLTLGALGLVLGAGTLGLIAGAGGSILAMLPPLVVCGLGFGWIIPSLVTVILRGVPAGLEGAASGLLVTTQQVAGAVGLALTGILYFGLLHHAAQATRAFAIALGFNLVLFLITAGLIQLLRGAEVSDDGAARGWDL